MDLDKLVEGKEYLITEEKNYRTKIAVVMMKYPQQVVLMVYDWNVT